MGHTYTQVHLHVIFSTKERRRWLAPDVQERLYQYMARIAENEFGEALVIGGIEDHLHGLVRLRSAVALATAMRKWKSLSSRWIHDTFPNLATFAWQQGYAAFSVSKSAVGEVCEYIRRQAEHHHRKTFEEEFVEFLKRHEIDYDPRYVFD